MRNRINRTILVVDDDRNDQAFILAAFRFNGVHDPIHFAESGSEAIAYLKGEGKFADRTQYQYPAFLLTDLKMPHGDGFSVLQYLRENGDWSVIPTVVLSSSADPDDVKRAYRLGASCYHQKPVGHLELRQQLKILHDYWMTCVVPQVDCAGKMLDTSCLRKLVEEFGLDGQGD